MADPSLKELLSVAADAAHLAGRRTLAHFNAGVDVEIKHDDTPVTIADREAERVVREVISRRYPTHGIVGEEGEDVRGDERYKWVIDPIDGTKSFIHGVPLYGVLIGVEVRGRPSVGVIYLPGTDELIAAADGEGCTWNGRACRVSDVATIEQATVLCGSVTRALGRSDAYGTIARRARLNRGWGDCYGYALVATGRAEAMLDPRIHPWDCAPLPPIFREAGGWCGTWSGEETIYGPDFVATNGRLKAEILSVLASERRSGAAGQA